VQLVARQQNPSDSSETRRISQVTGRHNLASRIPSVWLLRTSGAARAATKAAGKSATKSVVSTANRADFRPDRQPEGQIVPKSAESAVFGTNIKQGQSLPTREGAQPGTSGSGRLIAVEQLALPEKSDSPDHYKCAPGKSASRRFGASGSDLVNWDDHVGRQPQAPRRRKDGVRAGGCQGPRRGKMALDTELSFYMDAPNLADQ
jgi:hypothetical protein